MKIQHLVSHMKTNTPARLIKASKQTSVPCGPKFANGCNSGGTAVYKTLAEMVDLYQKMQNDRSGASGNPLKSLMDAYRELPELEEAITNSVKARALVGKWHSRGGNLKIQHHGHQRRTRKAAIAEALKRLKTKAKTRKLKEAQSFEKIIACVSNTCVTCSKIPGIGPLYIYDVALRIGAHLRRKPKKVYLQAGALTGAKALKKAKALNFDVRNAPLPVKDFPEPIQRLEPHEIEDFLCVFKDQFKNLKS